MKLGRHVTAAGSVVVISGDTGGRSEVTFDWVEEPHACADCSVRPYPENGYLVWDCEVCEGGEAELHLDVVTIEIPREAEKEGQ